MFLPLRPSNELFHQLANTLQYLESSLHTLVVQSRANLRASFLVVKNNLCLKGKKKDHYFHPGGGGGGGVGTTIYKQVQNNIYDRVKPICWGALAPFAPSPHLPMNMDTKYKIQVL